ncbi:hypothetical protein DL96DRAFT_1687977 [Flagelloscypha sp. PMI_526]|nr:hypothetical protein DL96DRAFT_1687977 [Flagelloscypha sp. PMI_526]
MSISQDFEEFQFYPRNMKAYFGAIQWGDEWTDALQSFSRGLTDAAPGISANCVYSTTEVARLQRAIFKFWTFVVTWEYEGNSSAQDYLNEMSLTSYLCLKLAGQAAQQVALRILKNSWSPRSIQQLVSVHPKMLGILVHAQNNDPSSVPDVIASTGFPVNQAFLRTPLEDLHVRWHSLPRERQFGGWIIYEPILAEWEKRQEAAISNS